MGVRVSLSRTDLGVPRATGIINLPKLVSSGKDPILSITYQVRTGDSTGRVTQRDAPECKDRRLSYGLFVSSLDTPCTNNETDSTSCDLSKCTEPSRKTC